MAVGSEIDRHRIAHVGKQLVPLGIDGGAEVFHSAEAVFSGDSRAKQVFSSVSTHCVGDEIEVFAVGRDSRMRQQRDRIFDDVGTLSLAPGGSAARRDVNLGGTRVDGVFGAVGIVHRRSVFRERGGTLVIRCRDGVLHLDGFLPCTVFIFARNEQGIVLQSGDTVDGVFVYNSARRAEIKLVVLFAVEHGAEFAAA